MRRGAAVTLIDQASRPGGRLRGEVYEDFALSPLQGSVSEADRRLLAFVTEVGLAEEWLPLRPVGTAIVHRGSVRDVGLRGLGEVARIPGVGVRGRLRLLRLPRLMARYADALDFENPAVAARLDDRSLADFGRLYFGANLTDRWLAPRSERTAPGDVHEMSRVQFLIEERRAGSAQIGLPRTTLDAAMERAAQSLQCKLETEVFSVVGTTRGAARVETSAGLLEADAVVLATDAAAAARIAGPALASAETDHLESVRYEPLLSVAAGLSRTAASRPREIWVPRSEPSPLARVLLEPGLTGGRVPPGRGLAWLRARREVCSASWDLPDDAVSKQLVEALCRLLPGWLRSVDFTRVFREERAAPRFDVGHYRALARFEAVQRDRRAAGRALYFAGDHQVHPSAEGAVVSGERAAQAAGDDLKLP